MSLPSDFATEDWYQLPNLSRLPPAKPHPDPLKSHSAQDVVPGRSVQYEPARDTIRPDSGVFANNAYDQRGLVDTYRTYRDTESLPSPPLATHPAFSSASTERFGNASSAQEYPVVPTRPPLRPTVSFGGETRTSYYSISTDTTGDIDKKSKISVSAIELEQQQHESGATEKLSWRFYTSLMGFCLLRFGCGLGATALSTTLPVSPVNRI